MSRAFALTSRNLRFLRRTYDGQETIGRFGDSWEEDVLGHQPSASHRLLPAGKIPDAVGHHYRIAAKTDFPIDKLPVGSMAVIESGWAMRCILLPDGRRHVVEVLIPGDLVSRSFGYFVQALTDASCFVLREPGFAELLGNQPDVAMAVAELMQRQRRRLELHATLLAQATAEERICSFFVELHARLDAEPTGSGAAFRLPLTQVEIADHLGMTDVHASRTLRRLREDGILTLHNGFAVIHDLAVLRGRSIVGTLR